MAGNEFGVNLALMLKGRKITGKKLAEELGVSYKTVQEWIGPNGRVPRNPDSIKKLAQYLGITTHRLLFGEDDPQSIIGAVLEKTEIHTGLYEITIKKVNQNKG